MTRFGKYFKEARIKKRITLREFCRKNNLDAGNMSKYERGLLLPPTDPAKIAGWMFRLGYAKTSKECYFVMRGALQDLQEVVARRFRPYMK